MPGTPGRLVEVIGGQDKIRSRAVNVRPAFPCKGIETPPMNAHPRTTWQLLAAARGGDESALAVLFERHRDRLERMVRLRMDSRLQGRVDPADVLQDAYLAVRSKFPQYIDNPPLPF